MKKVLYVAVFLLFSSLFVGCDDGGDDGNGNGNDVVKLVKSLSAAGKMLYEFEYDSQSRMTKAVTVHEDGNDIQSISYGKDMMTITRNDEGNDADPAILELYFDTDGYLTLAVFDDGEQEYAYSDDGYLERAVIYDDPVAFQWTNGNLVKAGYEDGGDTYIFEYGDKPNKLSVNFNPHILGGIGFYNFKGTYNKNLPLSQTFDFDGETNRTDYEYTFDKDGYPETIREIYAGGGRTITVAYY